MDDRLRAVSDFELTVNTEGVGFHGTGADHQLRRDLGIGHSCGHQTENFSFAGCQEVRSFGAWIWCSAKPMVEIGRDGVKGERFTLFPVQVIQITIDHCLQLGLKTVEQRPLADPIQGGIRIRKDPGEQLDGLFRVGFREGLRQAALLADGMNFRNGPAHPMTWKSPGMLICEAICALDPERLLDPYRLKEQGPVTEATKSPSQEPRGRPISPPHDP